MGSDKYIHYWGSGRAPPVTARGSGGALIALQLGSAAFFFGMKFTVISNTHHAISGSLEPAWIATRSSQCIVPTTQ